MKNLINKKIGNDFEQLLCRKLSELGFWVHNFANRSNGQPADIIAVRDGHSFLIDAKVCTRGRFPLRRIEMNQHMAMQKWKRCGNGDGMFAFLIDGEIYMLRYDQIKKTCQLSLSSDWIKRHSQRLGELCG